MTTAPQQSPAPHQSLHPTPDAMGAGEQSLADSVRDASLRRSQARSDEIEAQLARDPAGFRVLTGDRPTGNLHLGLSLIHI